MKLISVGLSLLALAVLLGAQAASDAPVPVSAEPHHHLVLDKPMVRVYEFSLGPRQATLPHTHERDYITVWLGQNSLANTVAGKPESILSPVDGQTALTKGPLTHVVKNLADTDARNVTIEILATAPQHTAETEPEAYSEAPGVTTKLLFENELVRAWDTQIDPGATQPRHEHRLDYLAIAVSPLDMKSLTDFKAPADIRKRPGEVTWVRAPVAHSITNMADTPARFISIEFK